MGLSPEGFKQAAVLCDYLRWSRFDAVFASPMKRVQQSIERWEHQGAVRTSIIEGFREVDFGRWTGLSWGQVNDQFQVGAHQWLDQLEQGLIPGAESVSDFRNRTEIPLQKILNEHRGHRIAVACHGGVIRMILSILLDLPFPKMGGFEFGYASVTIVHLLSHKTEVQLANFLPWQNAG